MYKQRVSGRDRGTSNAEAILLPKTITDEAYESERGLKRDDMSEKKYKPGRQIYSISQFDQSASNRPLPFGEEE